MHPIVQILLDVALKPSDFRCDLLPMKTRRLRAGRGPRTHAQDSKFDG